MSRDAATLIEIHDLYSRYAFAFDEGDADGWAALFTVDGRFSRPALDDLVGREQLTAFARERSGGGVTTRHFMSNVHVVEQTDDQARGQAYVLVYRGDETGLQLGTLGRYDDDLVKVDGAWCFGVRRFDAWPLAESPGAPSAVGQTRGDRDGI